MKSPHWSRFILKDCSPWEGLKLEQEIGDVKRKKKQKGAAYGLTTALQLPTLLGRGKRRNEVEPGRKGWGEEKML